MDTNKGQPQERLDNTQQLDIILAKLAKIEAYLEQHKTHQNEAPTEAPSMSTEQQVLLIKLDQLTLKRHAVLTAALGGVSYEDLATIMKCSQTTVKLHLKAALNILDIPSRTSLLASHKQLLDLIPDKTYKTRYGIGKRWWMETQTGDLMTVLTTVKPTNNQHQHEE